MDREELDKLSNKVIGIAIDVHKELGPGFIERIYEKAMESTFKKEGINSENQKVIKVNFRGEELGSQRVDFLVEKEIIIELKNVSEIQNIHKLQLLSYLKTNNNRLGLILNFAKEKIEIKRIVNGF